MLQSSDFLFQNFDKSPISDLRIIGINDSCPSGYAILSLGILPVINNGCISNSYYETVFNPLKSQENNYSFSKSSCPVNKGRIIGQSIISVNNNINYWRKSKICAKFTGVSLIYRSNNQASIASSQSCKVCKGYLNIDSTNDQFCVSINDECPIN